MSETEYVSQMLTKIKRFAQHHDVHVWVVAHPRQLRDWKGQPPTMYDISGSAHFINKADNGLVIHRNRDPQAGPMNEVSPCIDRQALDMSENACLTMSVQFRYLYDDRFCKLLCNYDGGIQSVQRMHLGMV